MTRPNQLNIDLAVLFLLGEQCAEGLPGRHKPPVWLVVRQRVVPTATDGIHEGTPPSTSNVQVCACRRSQHSISAAKPAVQELITADFEKASASWVLECKVRARQQSQRTAFFCTSQPIVCRRARQMINARFLLSLATNGVQEGTPPSTSNAQALPCVPRHGKWKGCTAYNMV
jgi:hypothetical protein